MGVLVDIVPNHVGVATPDAGTWWWDVLRHGQESAHAACFDIDWAAGGGRLLVPVLGDDADLGSGPRRSSATSCATTTTPSRSPPAPATGSPAEVHDRQHYRLVSWREADRGSTTGGSSRSTPSPRCGSRTAAVFDATHVEIKRWFDEGLVDGLRVDHPDGLRDPGRYLDDLAELHRRRLRAGREDPRARRGAARVVGDRRARPATTRSRSSTGCSPTRAGRHALDRARDRAARGARRLAPADPRHQARRRRRHPQLRGPPHRARAEVGVEARRHLRPEPGPPTRRRGRRAAGLLPGLPLLPARGPRATSTRRSRDARTPAPRPRRRPRPARAGAAATRRHPAALRFQQTSGMVMAKGVEDCAFYRYSRLTSLNEVGGDPSVFSLTVAEFHDAMARRQAGLAARDDRLDHARHQAQRGRPGPDRRRSPRSRTSGSRALDELLAARAAAGPGVRRRCSGRRCSAPGRSSRDARCTRTPRRRCARPATAPPGPTPTRRTRRAVHAAVDAAFDDERVRRRPR